MLKKVVIIAPLFIALYCFIKFYIMTSYIEEKELLESSFEILAFGYFFIIIFIIIVFFFLIYKYIKDGDI
jgi:uncharacterized BrkB/YihY/UPF0761 family membrane protein